MSVNVSGIPQIYRQSQQCKLFHNYKEITILKGIKKKIVGYRTSLLANQNQNLVFLQKVKRRLSSVKGSECVNSNMKYVLMS